MRLSYLRGSMAIPCGIPEVQPTFGVVRSPIDSRLPPKLDQRVWLRLVGSLHQAAATPAPASTKAMGADRRAPMRSGHCRSSSRLTRRLPRTLGLFVCQVTQDQRWICGGRVKLGHGAGWPCCGIGSRPSFRGPRLARGLPAGRTRAASVVSVLGATAPVSGQADAVGGAFDGGEFCSESCYDRFFIRLSSRALSPRFRMTSSFSASLPFLSLIRYPVALRGSSR